MFSLIALYLSYRKQDAVVIRATTPAPVANDRMQAAALRLAA